MLSDPCPGATGWDKFRAYVVIDEAQLLMGGAADARASLSKYAAEARKLRNGLILATQLRDNVPLEIWGNIDTRLFMQALDPTERARNAKALGLPEMLLQQLPKGEAYMTRGSQVGPPLRIRIEPQRTASSSEAAGGLNHGRGSASQANGPRS